MNILLTTEAKILVLVKCLKGVFFSYVVVLGLEWLSCFEHMSFWCLVLKLHFIMYHSSVCVCMIILSSRIKST